jgi:hypothetical protein
MILLLKKAYNLRIGGIAGGQLCPQVLKIVYNIMQGGGANNVKTDCEK